MISTKLISYIILVCILTTDRHRVVIKHIAQPIIVISLPSIKPFSLLGPFILFSFLSPCPKDAMNRTEKKLASIAKISKLPSLSPITTQARITVQIGVVFTIIYLSRFEAMPNQYVTAVKATIPNRDREKSLSLWFSCTKKLSPIQFIADSETMRSTMFPSNVMSSAFTYFSFMANFVCIPVMN